MGKPYYKAVHEMCDSKSYNQPCQTAYYGIRKSNVCYCIDINSNETIQIEWDSFEYLQKKLSGRNNSRSKITRQILLHDSRKEVRMQKNTKNEPVSGGISIHRGGDDSV